MNQMDALTEYVLIIIICFVFGFLEGIAIKRLFLKKERKEP